MESKFKSIKICENGEHDILIYADGKLMWFCDTWNDVNDQLNLCREFDLIDDETVISSS